MIAITLLVAACLNIPWLMQLPSDAPSDTEWAVAGFIVLTVLQLALCGLVWYLAELLVLYFVTAVSVLQLFASFGLGNLAAVTTLHAWRCCDSNLSELDPFIDHLSRDCSDNECPMTLVEQAGLVLCAWVVFYCSMHVLLWHNEMRVLITIDANYELYPASAPLRVDPPPERTSGSRRTHEMQVM